MLFLSIGAARAQSPAVIEARRLQEAHDFRAAVRLLQDHLSAHPDDGDAARLLAQTLYWMRDVEGARKAYEAALARHTDDEHLRIDYARMLTEIDARRSARDVLEPIAATSARADVQSLLGTLAYWDGDFTTAARLFERTLQIDPAHAEAARQLREIRRATAPWLRVSPAYFDDDQPLSRATVAAEAAVSLTPLTSLRLACAATRHSSASASRRTWTADAGVRHYAPRARVELELAAGVRGGLVTDAPAFRWTGRAALGVRLPDGLTITGRIERAPYLVTASSLEADVYTDTATAELSWTSRRGWMARAALSEGRYPDRNRVHVRYAWALAPIVRSTGADVRAGYAVAWEDADETRFVLADPMQPVGPADPSVETRGRYAPYYTPENVLRHSVTAAVTSRAGSRGTLRLGGSLPLHATEDAPQLLSANGTIVRTFATREFHPWEVRGSLDLRLAEATTLGFSAEAGKGAFYRWSTAGVHVTFRFHPKTALPLGSR